MEDERLDELMFSRYAAPIDFLKDRTREGKR